METPVGFDSAADLTRFGGECEPRALMPDPGTIFPDTSSSQRGKDFAQLPPGPAPGTIVLDTRISRIDVPIQQPGTDSPSPNRDECEDWQGFGSEVSACNECGREGRSPLRAMKEIGNIAFIENRLEQKTRSKASDPEDDSVTLTNQMTVAEELSLKDTISPSAILEVRGLHEVSPVASHAWSRRLARLLESNRIGSYTRHRFIEKDLDSTDALLPCQQRDNNSSIS
jgi:hypothetical protein